jgi:hypothetical protein|tara:strand:+ start:1963 stop:2283 length:321 start_codon:yes stop_codon:yes gene_type:complete
MLVACSWQWRKTFDLVNVEGVFACTQGRNAALIQMHILSKTPPFSHLSATFQPFPQQTKTALALVCLISTRPSGTDVVIPNVLTWCDLGDHSWQSTAPHFHRVNWQ